jgi:hypothetical protein
MTCFVDGSSLHLPRCRTTTAPRYSAALPSMLPRGLRTSRTAEPCWRCWGCCAKADALSQCPFYFLTPLSANILVSLSRALGTPWGTATLAPVMARKPKPVAANGTRAKPATANGITLTEAVQTSVDALTVGPADFALVKLARQHQQCRTDVRMMEGLGSKD